MLNTYVFNLAREVFTLSDSSGYFKIGAAPGDTIYATQMSWDIGMVVYHQTDTLPDIILHKTPYQLPEVRIYPWPGKDRFKEDFLSMKPQLPKEMKLNLPEYQDSFDIAGFDLMKYIPKIKLYPGVYLFFLPYPDLIVNIDRVYEEIHKKSRKRKHIGEVPVFK